MSAYLLTATMGLGAAYGLTLFFVSPAHSQTGKAEAPSDGSLPPEFMNQIESAPAGTPPPPPPPTGAASGAAAPPAATASESAPPPPPEPPAASPAPPSEAPAPAAGTAVGTEEYVYDGAGRRDPFKPYRTIRVQSSPKEAQRPEEVIEPLQRFELDQISVVAILWDVQQPRALVRDAEGKTHTLVKNTKLGRHSGYVAAIREGEIVVIETVDLEGGGTMKRTRVLEFKRQARD